MSVIKHKIKKGDKVLVISGSNKGSEGTVLSVNKTTNRIIVEGVNLVKRHTKPNARHEEGGIIQKEAPIHISNVMLVVNGEPTKVGRKKEGGKIVRYSKKTGNII